MYLMVSGSFKDLKRAVMVSFNQGPTSAKILLPPASRSPELAISVSPQPSATTITQWPVFLMSVSMCFST